MKNEHEELKKQSSSQKNSMIEDSIKKSQDREENE